MTLADGNHIVFGCMDHTFFRTCRSRQKIRCLSPVVLCISRWLLVCRPDHQWPILIFLDTRRILAQAGLPLSTYPSPLANRTVLGGKIITLVRLAQGGYFILSPCHVQWPSVQARGQDQLHVCQCFSICDFWVVRFHRLNFPGGVQCLVLSLSPAITRSLCGHESVSVRSVKPYHRGKVDSW